MEQNARQCSDAKAKRQKEWREANGYVFNGNKLIEVLPFEQIETVYSEHRRLRVFANKGYACGNCGRVGTHFLSTVDRKGNVHRDLYTADNVLMTIDHVIPKVKGGSSELENLVPLCQPCNSAKGHTI